MEPHSLSRDSKTETGSAAPPVPAWCRTEEGQKDVRQHGIWYARPRIENLYADVLTKFISPAVQKHFRTRSRVADCIAKHVVNCAAQKLRIGKNRHILTGSPNPAVGMFRLKAGIFDDVLAQRLQ